MSRRSRRRTAAANVTANATARPTAAASPGPAATATRDLVEKDIAMPTTVAQEQDRKLTAAAQPEPASPEPADRAAPVRTRRERPRLRRTLRALRTTVVVLALLAAAGIGGTYVVDRRQAAQAFLDVGTAVLTADPVLVGSADAGVVRAVKVTEQDSVTTGAALARVTLTADGTSDEPKVQTLRAPVAGIVADVNVPVGGVARAGEPVVTLYDPGAMTFQAEVPLEQLRQLRLGMTVYIDGAGLDRRVTTVLDQVVPQVSSDPTRTSDRLTVVLKPAAAETATVRSLVPGLRFDAVVDTKTATGGIPAVNSA